MSDRKNKMREGMGELAAITVVALLVIAMVLTIRDDSRKSPHEEAPVMVSSGWHLSTNDAVAMAQAASEDLKSLIGDMDGSVDDKVTVLMGAFCGRWVDWRLLMIDDYDDSQPYPLLQYRLTAKQLYEELVEQSKSQRLSFYEAQGKACTVI